MKGLGLITLARVIVIACQLVNIKLFTHYLNLEQLGFYFFLLTLSFFANALLFGPIDYYQQANLGRIVQTTGGIRPLTSFNLKLMGWYLLALIFAGVAGGIFAPRYLYHILLAGSLAAALHTVQALRNVLNNLGHKNAVSLNLIQEAVLKITVFAVLVRCLKPNELVLMSAWLITLAASAVTLFLQAKKQGLLRAKAHEHIRPGEVFRFSYPLSIGAVANWVQLQGYRLILVPLGFTETVGIFSTVSGIGSAGMAAAATIYTQAASPAIYRTAGKYTARYLRNAALLTGGILMVGLILGAWIVPLATKPVFGPFWALMLFGILTDASNLMIGGLAIHITLTGSTGKIMKSSFTGVAVLLASFLILFFTKNVNVYTIGVPLVLSQLAVMAYMYWNFRKRAA